MKAVIYTHGINFQPDRAYAAMRHLLKQIAEAHLKTEVCYFDGDVSNWFGTQEKITQRHGDDLIIIHVDELVLRETEESVIADLCEKFGMIAVAEGDQIITKEGRKDARSISFPQLNGGLSTR